MAAKVTAQDGDTLCTIAINNGFDNCLKLRDIDANSAFKSGVLKAGDVVTVPDLNPSENDRPTDNQHKFQIKNRQVGIRFVHGSASLPFDQDLTLTELNISNFTTNLAGVTEGAKLPDASQAHFDANADVDSDAFKVEVIETRPPGATLEVIIEPLLPTYDAGDTLNGHKDFDGDPKDQGTVRGFRSLIGKALKMEGKRFRTGYLRLVVDSLDTAARTQQTVLVTDNVSNGDRKAEILDQDIRATYILKDCPIGDDKTKCRAMATVPIGRGRVVKLALQVLRATPTGVVETVQGGPGDDGVVKLKDIQTRVDTFCRRHWAQDVIQFKTVLAQTVDLPSNMLTVSDNLGAPAAGHAFNSTTQGQVSFSVSVQRFGKGTDINTQAVSPVLVNAGATPEATANDIVTAINGVDGLTARVSVNPAEVRTGSGASQLGSADILITDSQNGRVTIPNISGADVQDQDQTVSVSNLSLIFAVRNDLANYHVGSQHERNLFKMLDTGDDRLDIFVVSSFDSRPTLVGFTVTAQTDLDASRRPMSGMFNSIVMRTDASDSTDGFPYALPHEIGHALLDCAQHADGSRQLMFPTTAPFNDVNDARRLLGLDPPATNWNNLITNASLAVVNQRIRMNTLSRLLDKSSGLMN
jgi:hypothetical protein